MALTLLMCHFCWKEEARFYSSSQEIVYILCGIESPCKITATDVIFDSTSVLVKPARQFI